MCVCVCGKIVVAGSCKIIDLITGVKVSAKDFAACTEHIAAYCVVDYSCAGLTSLLMPAIQLTTIELSTPRRRRKTQQGSKLR